MPILLPLLVTILVYAVSIAFVRWADCDLEECACSTCPSESPGLMQKAASNLPRMGWMFHSAGRVKEYAFAPFYMTFVMLLLIPCFPVILVQHFVELHRWKKNRYFDPCFLVFNDYLLEANHRTVFDRYQHELVSRQYRPLGTFKYNPKGISELVRYFLSPDGKKLVSIYCLHDEFQINIGSVCRDGSAVLCTGVAESLMNIIRHPEQRVDDCWWTRLESLQLNDLMNMHKKMCREWCDEAATELAIVDFEQWKDACRYLSRIGTHARVKAGQLESTDAPTPNGEWLRPVVSR